MSVYGQVIGGPASPSYDGATLTADLHVGDLVLNVDDVADFDEDAGARAGAVLVGVDLLADGTIDTTTGTALPYLTCDDNADTITLVATSTVAASAGDRVYIKNPATGEAVGSTEVMVAIDDADTTGDALVVSIDQALLGGLAFPDLSDHAIELDEDDDGQLVVVNLPGLAQALPSYAVGTDPSVQQELDQLQTDLDANDAALAQAQTDLANNSTAIAANQTAIANANTAIAANTTAINNNATAITTANTQIAANTTAVSTLNNKFPVGNTDIQDGAISTPKMTANSINGDRILANTLNAAKIVSGSITTAQMTANSINGDRITGNTLDAGKIVAGSITTAQMTANTINGDRITTNTLDAQKIVAGSITTDRMTANTINGDRITVNTLNADRIVANSITGDKIAANSISASQMVVGGAFNWIGNPGFESGSTMPHSAAGGSAFIVLAGSGNQHSGTYGARISCSSARASGAYGYAFTCFGMNVGMVRNNVQYYLPVTPGDGTRVGDTLHWEAWVHGSVAGHQAKAYLDLIDAAGNPVVNVAGSTVTGSAWGLSSGDYTIPATNTTAAYANLAVATANNAVNDFFYIDDLFLGKAITGQLIVNGTITGHTITGGVLQTQPGMSKTAGVSGMIIQNDAVGGVIQFFNGQGTVSSPEQPGSINPKLLGGGTNQPALVIATPTSVVGSSAFDAQTKIQIQAGGTYAGGIVMEPGVYITNTGAGKAFMQADGWIQGAQVFTISPGASASAANVRWNSAATGQLLVNTSLTAAKVNIEPVAVERLRRLLDVNVVEFNDRQEWEDNGRSARGLQLIPGVLAEDVDAIEPLFADYGGDGKLTGVMYDRLGLICLPLLRDLYARVEALEGATS